MTRYEAHRSRNNESRGKGIKGQPQHEKREQTRFNIIQSSKKAQKEKERRRNKEIDKVQQQCEKYLVADAVGDGKDGGGQLLNVSQKYGRR